MIHLNRSCHYFFTAVFALTSFLLLSLLPIFSHAQEYIPLGRCGDSDSKFYKPISDIQGSSVDSNSPWISPLIHKWVVVEGIVTLDKSKEYQGFWLQQEDAMDSYKNASHGVFIYHSRAVVKVGQKIRLLAQVAEYQGLTELKRVKALTVCAHNLPLPKPKLITLPVASLAILESLEGMRILIKQDLRVSDLFGAGYGLGNYGQFAISSRLHYQPTERYRAEDLYSKDVQVSDKNLDYLLVDDGFSSYSPQFIPFPNKEGFSANNPLRIGDEIHQISAILHRYGEYYILIPEGDASAINIRTKPRPKHPIISSQANIVVASMNIENYFNGNPTSLSNRNVGFPTSRGAKSYAQFLMQTQKLVSAITAMDADVIALMELENDGYGEHSAIADLTRALNTHYSLIQQGENKYQYIIPNRKTLGKDEISIGILYRGHNIKAAGPAYILDASTSATYRSQQGYKPLFNDGYNRPSVLQRFIMGEKSFYLAVNHLKSKGRPCAENRNEKASDKRKQTYRGKAEAAQGNCNLIRTQAMKALVKFIAEKVQKKNDPVLIVGDLNSYSQEDPLFVLESAGYEHLKTDFSYSFQGYLGNLDHALANDFMLPFIRSIDSWSINAVEDVLLKYDSHYAQPDAYRSSDHDPLVIGIEL